MEDTEIEKNRLELAYKRKTQMMNAVLILATTGVLSLIGSFLWYPNRWFFGFVLTTIIWIISYSWYQKLDTDLKEISKKIDSLKGFSKLGKS